MNKHPTTSGLSPDKLAKLWTIGSETEQAGPAIDEGSRKTELLLDLLAGALPAPTTGRKSRLTEKTRRQSVVGSITDKAIAELILDSGTDVALLRRVKEYGKKLSDNTKGKAESHVAGTIYYATIASALVFHDKRITKFSYEDLRNYFNRLDKEEWIPQSLRSLFSKAAEYCQMRRSRL